MAENVWDELWKEEFKDGDVARRPAWLVNKDWLYEVKAEGDELKRKAAGHKEAEKNWLEQEKAYMSCIDELKGFKIDAEVMSRKLKAVEDWFESEKGYNTPGFEELGKLLEVS